MALRIRQYQVDAFTSRLFGGNPAAVCPLEAWLDDGLLQSIAAENNLSETAFFVKSDQGFHLRWFTPLAEVKLCGHATLAAAHVIFEHFGHTGPDIAFETLSGTLTVKREAERLIMDYPSMPPAPCAAPAALLAGLGMQPSEVLASDDYVAVFDNEDTVRAIAPDFAELTKLDLRGVMVTAPGDKLDFVSRFFAPKFGIQEDPVTGSAHCTLIPYWSARLGKQRMQARQISRRIGDIECELKGPRVELAGQAITFMQAEIYI